MVNKNNLKNKTF